MHFDNNVSASEWLVIGFWLSFDPVTSSTSSMAVTLKII